MGKIVAIGGGEIGSVTRDGTLNEPVETTDIDIEILKLTGRLDPKLLFIPTASDDSPEYYSVVAKHFMSLGCKEVNVLNLSDKSLDYQNIENTILSHDALYVGGGNTLKMMTIWRKLKVDNILKKAYEMGIVLSGLSAGSICWFQFGNSDSRKFTSGSDRLIKVSGLGFIDALHCPHYNSEVSRQEDLKRMMKSLSSVAIALDDCMAMEVVDDKYRFIRSNSSAQALKAYWKQGQYCTQELVVSEEFQDLNLLLQKTS